MAPHRVISWQRAIVLSFLGKVEVLELWDETVRSPTITVRTPAVVRLTHASAARKTKCRFSRENVFLRDGFRCQYCGEKRPPRELNYDHVVPRKRGGKTSWENIVASCYGCNHKKGSRTPEEAGMKLRKKPYRPTSLPFAPLLPVGRDVPAIWQAYVAGL
jgi:5-methylcytosine-specific restriction endonuclease McrA